MERADVEILRAVRAIVFVELKDILCKHYDVTPRRMQGWRRECSEKGGRNENLHLYRSVTQKLGVKQDAVNEIVTLYKSLQRENEDECHLRQSERELDTDEVIPRYEATAEDGLETEDDFRLRQCVRELDTDEVIPRCEATPEDGEDVAGSECNASSYDDAFDCNTTQHCYLDTVALDGYESDACEYLDDVGGRGDDAPF